MDLYICVAYLPLESSVYTKNTDIFQEFTSGINYYSTLGNAAVIGDINDRVGTKVEKQITLNFDHETPPGIVSKRDVPSRNSEDVVTNYRVRKLSNLMTNHHLLLTSDRLCVDLKGRYTCCQWNGASAVDYLMIQSDLFNRINYFKVGQFNWASDHAHITADIAVDIVKYREVPAEWKKVYKQFQIWYTDSKAKVREILYTDEFRGELEQFCNTDYPTSIEVATRLASISQRAIHNVFPRKIKDRKPNKSKQEFPYSHELQLAKRIYKKSKSPIPKQPVKYRPTSKLFDWKTEI